MVLTSPTHTTRLPVPPSKISLSRIPAPFLSPSPSLVQCVILSLPAVSCPLPGPSLVPLSTLLSFTSTPCGFQGCFFSVLISLMRVYHKQCKTLFHPSVREHAAVPRSGCLFWFKQCQVSVMLCCVRYCSTPEEPSCMPGAV